MHRRNTERLLNPLWCLRSDRKRNGISEGADLYLGVGEWNIVKSKRMEVRRKNRFCFVDAQSKRANEDAERTVRIVSNEENRAGRDESTMGKDILDYKALTSGRTLAEYWADFRKLRKYAKI